MSTFQPKVFETESNLRLHILREKISIFAKEKACHFLPWGDVRHETLKSWMIEILNKHGKRIATFELDVLANSATYVKVTCWEAEGQNLLARMEAKGILKFKTDESLKIESTRKSHAQIGDLAKNYLIDAFIANESTKNESAKSFLSHTVAYLADTYFPQKANEVMLILAKEKDRESDYKDAANKLTVKNFTGTPDTLNRWRRERKAQLENDK